MTSIEILRSILIIPFGFFVIGCISIIQDSSRFNGYIVMIGSCIWFFTWYYVLKYYRKARNC